MFYFVGFARMYRVVVFCRMYHSVFFVRKKFYDYHFLSYDIDVVLHAAAYVNLIYPYQALHGCNVVGTRNIIEFCFKNKIKPLHYISTDAVFPCGLIDVDEDTPPTDTFEKLGDGYGQTKYVAEQLVLRFFL
ncbi:unnamed protein product [Meloidogyne enterolobii]|uniref:Uncharacterized protein n=1 Tax=Meloidogyne enterolobii TaxID=390850 RepID=A0ACB0YNN7_MELEN